LYSSFFFSRPSDSELIKARKSRIRDKLTGAVIKEIVIYLLFLCIVSKLAYAEKDYHQYMFREDMVNMFEKATYTNGSMKFDKVTTYFLI